MTTDEPTHGTTHDDPGRELTLASRDDPDAHHLGVVGDTYTVLVDGEQTDGRYALIDMHVPPGGAPPPHRHAFEELFFALEGEVEVMVGGEASTLFTGTAANIPAGAVHGFTNRTDAPARLLCVVVPAGLERVFEVIGDPIGGPLATAPAVDEETMAVRFADAGPLMDELGIENIPPPE